MIDKLKERLKGQCLLENIQVLEEIEHRLVFDKFDSGDVLDLGNLLIQLSQTYPDDIILKITRIKDNLPIFQYIGDGKTERNINFSDAKSNTVIRTGHCSLWAAYQQLIYGGLDSLFEPDSGCLPVGGAFPVFVENQLVATIAISGLHNGLDHQLILDGLCSYLKKEIPVFHGTLI